MPLKQGKTSQHHNWPRYMDCPQIGPKSAIKLGKQRQKDKWYLFRRPPPPWGAAKSRQVHTPETGKDRPEGPHGKMHDVYCLAWPPDHDFAPSAPKSERFLRLRCPSRTPEIANDFRDFALRFEGAMESRVSGKRETPCFFGGFPLLFFFSRKARVGGSG